MKYPKYPVVVSADCHTYSFFSDGTRGRIAKVIIYSQIEGDLFNLGFGDWSDKLQDLDDTSRSNNGDRNKVLATVAFTALHFTNRFPNAKIVVEGSTSARTRLYQMEIAGNLLEINKNFVVEGLFAHDWEPFLRGRNYRAFLIKRK